jgi:hypothetical protein
LRPIDVDKLGWAALSFCPDFLTTAFDIQFLCGFVSTQQEEGHLSDSAPFGGVRRWQLLVAQKPLCLFCISITPFAAFEAFEAFPSISFINFISTKFALF